MTIAVVNSKYYIKSIKPLLYTYDLHKALVFEMPDESYVYDLIYQQVKYSPDYKFTLDFVEYNPGVIFTLDDLSQLLDIPKERIFLKDIPTKNLIKVKKK
jgi:hypothetical protein